jgi:hypothetical protein
VTPFPFFKLFAKFLKETGIPFSADALFKNAVILSLTFSFSSLSFRISVARVPSVFGWLLIIPWPK